MSLSTCVSECPHSGPPVSEVQLLTPDLPSHPPGFEPALLSGGCSDGHRLLSLCPPAEGHGPRGGDSGSSSAAEDRSV